MLPARGARLCDTGFPFLGSVLVNQLVSRQSQHMKNSVILPCRTDGLAFGGPRAVVGPKGALGKGYGRRDAMVGGQR